MIKSFNSLFEMQLRLVVADELIDEVVLSILYLRCGMKTIGPPPMAMGLMLSILYLRCLGIFILSMGLGLFRFQFSI